MCSDNSKDIQPGVINIDVSDLNIDLILESTRDLFLSLHRVKVEIRGTVMCEYDKGREKKKLVYNAIIKDRYDFDPCILNHCPYIGGYYGGSSYYGSSYYGSSYYGSSYYGSSYYGLGSYATILNEGAVALQSCGALQNYDITIVVQENSKYEIKKK